MWGPVSDGGTKERDLDMYFEAVYNCYGVSVGSLESLSMCLAGVSVDAVVHCLRQGSFKGVAHMLCDEVVDGEVVRVVSYFDSDAYGPSSLVIVGIEL